MPGTMTKRHESRTTTKPARAVLDFEGFVRAAMATGKPPRTKTKKAQKAKRKDGK